MNLDPTAFIYVSLFMTLYFEVFLLVTFIERRREVAREETLSSTATPNVTIIVPCWNEESTVAGTLDSIRALDYPKDRLEIIVVNDGSTDNTQAVLEAYHAQHPEITFISKENGGKHTALNAGIAIARGEIIGCLDADSFVAPNALREVVKYFEDPTTMAVTPSVRVWRPEGLLQRMQEAEYDMSIFIQKSLSLLGALTVTPGPFSFFRACVFKELGGYRHAHSTEDMEYAMRMQKAGYKIVNAHTARVFTKTPKTLKTLYKQRRRWTYGFLANARDYHELFFKTRYGNVSVLTMPYRFFAIFSSLVLVGIIIINFGSFVIRKFNEWSAIDFNLSLGVPTIDLFYVNVNTLVFVEGVVVIFALSLIVAGKLLAKKHPLSRDILYFLFLYGLLAPLWIGSAVWNFLRSRSVAWR